MKAPVGYCIQEKKGALRIHTIRCQRKDCINSFTKDWKEAKKYGWKCVKVKIFKFV
jgi:hypothetical protein